MHDIASATVSRAYTKQSAGVRARFKRLKAREVILDVKRLTKHFGTGQGSTVALNKISFTTHRREFLCVDRPFGLRKINADPHSGRSGRPARR